MHVEFLPPEIFEIDLQLVSLVHESFDRLPAKKQQVYSDRMLRALAAELYAQEEYLRVNIEAKAEAARSKEVRRLQDLAQHCERMAKLDLDGVAGRFEFLHAVGGHFNLIDRVGNALPVPFSNVAQLVKTANLHGVERFLVSFDRGTTLALEGPPGVLDEIAGLNAMPPTMALTFEDGREARLYTAGRGYSGSADFKGPFTVSNHFEVRPSVKFGPLVLDKETGLLPALPEHFDKWLADCAHAPDLLFQLAKGGCPR